MAPPLSFPTAKMPPAPWYADLLSHGELAVMETCADFAEAIAQAQTVEDALRLHARAAALIVHLEQISAATLLRADALCQQKD